MNSVVMERSEEEWHWARNWWKHELDGRKSAQHVQAGAQAWGHRWCGLGLGLAGLMGRRTEVEVGVWGRGRRAEVQATCIGPRAEARAGAGSGSQRGARKGLGRS